MPLDYQNDEYNDKALDSSEQQFMIGIVGDKSLQKLNDYEPSLSVNKDELIAIHGGTQDGGIDDKSVDLLEICASLDKDPLRTREDYSNTATLLFLHGFKRYDEFVDFRNKNMDLVIRRYYAKHGSFKEFTEMYPGKDNEIKTIEYEDKRKYFGQVSRTDKKEGFGILFESDGSMYEGHFYNDYKSGPGNLYCSTGEFYSGRWHKDRLHGDATYLVPNESVYKGNWVSGLKDGFGEERTASGEK